MKTPPKSALVRAMTAIGLIAVLTGTVAHAQDHDQAATFAGAWTLVAADVVHADGTRGHDYGTAPRGLLLVDAQGHYSLQIMGDARLKFTSGDKTTGTEAEYRAAVVGISSHFGTLTVDPSAHALVFSIDAASYPNWDHTQQKRVYELKDNELTYRVAPRPNGDVPVSVWRRLD